MTNWIDCYYATPSQGCSVIVYCPGNFCSYMAYKTHDGKWEFFGNSHEDPEDCELNTYNPPSHWMMPPKHPKKD